MYKTILVTVDLAHKPSWELALPEAIALAKTSGGVLHVLTVVPKIPSTIISVYLPEEFEGEAINNANKQLASIIDEHIGDAVVSYAHVTHGLVHEEILHMIETVKADLVVMASHAPDRVREFLVGSQADRVVRRSPVSVFVVRG